ncbi:hypothetical protein KQH89_21520, partial [Vibrio cholerae]|uniref:hypothetical protein n=1 Tax=Vibrio cholerae TaxID=666 RepID=UPI001C113619
AGVSFYQEKSSKAQVQRFEKSAFKLSDLVFEFQADVALVESVGSSTVSKLLKANKSRCFKVVGCSTLKVWFHKR